MSLEERENLRKSLRSKYKKDQAQAGEWKSEDDKRYSNKRHSMDLNRGVLDGYPSNNFSSIQYNPENTSQAVDLEANKKAQERMLEIVKLNTKLAEYEKLITTQKQELEGLTNTLLKTREEKDAAVNKLQLVEPLLHEKELELNKVKERLNKEDIDKLKYDLCQSQEKYKEVSILLRKERDQNADIKKEISVLRKSLSSRSTLEKDLEIYATRESEKTKKLENQLDFLLEKFNELRKYLYVNLTALNGQSEEFFKHYENHHRALMASINEVDI